MAVLSTVLALPASGQVELTQEANRIVVHVDGKPFTNLYLSGEKVVKPFFYPIRSASGKIVTRLYPLKTVPGESHDHPHHCGLWFAHGNVNGFDFWSSTPERTGNHYGTIVLTKVDEVHSGKEKGWLTAEFAWKGPGGKTILTEKRTVTFFSNPTLRVMDFDILLTGVERAHFGDTKEGTFAIRVAASMNEKHGGTLINAAGKTGEKNVWGKRSPWMDYYGEVEGEKLGIAIFDHPDNPKHPTYWHARGYGLFAANIFGEHNFYHDEARDGGMTLEKGKTWRFRYAVVIHPGNAASAGIAKLYKEYAR